MKRILLKWGWLVVLSLAGWPVTTAQAGEELRPEAAKWLAAQTNIQTWSADFTQIRKLKSLTQPLTSHGHVWFEAPSRFRWELGHPPQTIAVRTTEGLLILYPQLKRAERFVLAGNQTGPWRDALSLLEAGFPRSRAELEARYDIVSQDVSDGIGKIVMQPKSAAAGRIIPRIEIDYDTHDYSLRGTELEFADGSTMRNNFDHIELNPKVDPQMFSPPIPPGYKVTEPNRK